MPSGYPSRTLKYYWEWYRAGFRSGGMHYQHAHTTVGIYIGQRGYHSRNAEAGDLPAVSLWDEAGRRYGSWDGHLRTLDGNYYEISIQSQGLGDVRPTYVSLTSTRGDDICISAVIVTFLDRTSSAFTGDIASACGFAVGISDTVIGDKQYRPNCVWIDGDHKPRQNVPQGISFHLPDFQLTPSRERQYRMTPASLCSTPARISQRAKTSWRDPVRMFRPPLKYNPDGTDMDIERVLSDHVSEGWTDDFHKHHQHPDGRGGHDWVYPIPRLTRSIHSLWSRVWTRSLGVGQETNTINRVGHSLEDTIIISNHTRHSAIEVCNNENFYGANMVSLQEQIYCDMMSRQTLPVCSPEQLWSCYDLDTNQVRGSRLHIAGGLQPSGNNLALVGYHQHGTPVQSFTNVLKWN